MVVLTVNAGSSSVRLALFSADGERLERRASARQDGHPGRAEEAIAGLRRECPGEVALVAHRVVHGGEITRTSLVDAEMERAIEAATPLAPLHNPTALAWIRACQDLLPAARAVVVFDTGFFAELPAAAATYALPPALVGRRRRLGFHGLAHRSMLAALRRCAPERAGRVISFQLGGGCSAAALRDGRPVDTSMGFTPLEGLVMGTRAGDLDPGLLLDLLRETGWSPARMQAALSDEAGLLGLAGTSDVAALLARSDPSAALALEVFSYRIKKYLGAYLAALGRCDAVIVGGGIGEHAAAVRSRALGGLEGLGLRLDEAANQDASAPARISAADSAIDAWVVPTDEETVLAEEALAVGKDGEPGG